MRTTRLYTQSHLQCGTNLKLDKIASHHLIRVLRQKKGAAVIVFNGDGHEYSAELLNENAKSAEILIQQQHNPITESSLDITLLQGISRGDRMDTTIQKATELGVKTIVPVVCERTNIHFDKARIQKKQSHWQQIVISACEQSGRCYVPEVTQQSGFQDVVTVVNADSKIVLHPDAEHSLKGLASDLNTITILSGPEGGLTDQELDFAITNGFVAVQMGPRVLRTETAAPACIAALQVLFGDCG